MVSVCRLFVLFHSIINKFMFMFLPKSIHDYGELNVETETAKVISFFLTYRHACISAYNRHTVQQIYEYLNSFETTFQGWAGG